MNAPWNQLWNSSEIRCIFGLSMICSGQFVQDAVAADNVVFIGDATAASAVATPAIEAATERDAPQTGNANVDPFYPCDSIAATEAEIDAMQRAVEDHVRQQFRTGFNCPHFKQPATPDAWLGDMNFHDEPAGPWPQGPGTFSRARSARSSSSWMQRDSRFTYEQSVRGLVVRLSGSAKSDALTVDRVEISTNENRDWKGYAKVAEVPAEYQDEVETARTSALQYVRPAGLNPED